VDSSGGGGSSVVDGLDERCGQRDGHAGQAGRGQDGSGQHDLTSRNDGRHPCSAGHGLAWREQQATLTKGRKLQGSGRQLWQRDGGG
jgi:hypothetical protein